jgi:hypothetical protein
MEVHRSGNRLRRRTGRRQIQVKRYGLTDAAKPVEQAGVVERFGVRQDQ